MRCERDMNRSVFHTLTTNMAWFRSNDWRPSTCLVSWEETASCHN